MTTRDVGLYSEIKIINGLAQHKSADHFAKITDELGNVDFALEHVEEAMILAFDIYVETYYQLNLSGFASSKNEASGIILDKVFNGLVFLLYLG